MRRSIQPSKPRPFTKMSRAAPSFFASAGLWLIDMGVAIRADEGRDLDPLAADIAGEIGKNRKGRDDRQFFRGLRLGGPGARGPKARKRL